MPQPNLFIIGAPKCGTTSIWHYLSEHPHIYMARPKEPHYFNFDHKYRNITDWQSYLQIFEYAPAEAQVVGEASVWYLYSNVAVPEILKRYPNAQFIVLLRNPVEAFIALHEQLHFHGREPADTPQAAWDLQWIREQGNSFPKDCIEPDHLKYRLACAFGSQLTRLLENAPRHNVLPLLLDDLKTNTREEYMKVLDFLGVPDDGRTDFRAYNTSKRLRSKVFHKAIKRAQYFTRRSGIRFGSGLLVDLKRRNTASRERSPLDRDFRDKLQKAFASEIRLLEEILGRDLRTWMTTL